jgi:DNA mismatch repair protein MSH6
MLNRCITPSGKRMLKQWVCHPLADAAKINARLDAVDTLNANDAFRDVFTSQLSKLPDLERLISRVHAGNSKAQDFVRVLEGFERIQGAIEEIKLYGTGEGLIEQLLMKMPNLEVLLQPWGTAFDREKAKKDGVLVPERGVESDFDESQDNIEAIMEALNGCLKKYSTDLK